MVVHIANGKATELTNVNVGGVDCPPGVVTYNVTLTAAEADALMVAQVNEPVLLMASGASTEEIRLASKILRLGRNPGL